MQANFEEFVVARGRALLRFAYLLTGDGYLAEDLVQEALLRSHRRWSAVERTDNPEPYVRKAILHLYLSWRRRRSSTELSYAELPDRPGAEQPPDAVVERDAMWLLLRQLPRTQRAVVVLRYYEDLSDADIAVLLGCAKATVRVHAFKALAKLRAALATQPAVMGVRHE
ncbi:SigE family RNA polymerase sigma factor [Micromonospora polyrhachis]|uniref:RNA polymerase sigma-70 factor (Sigma-E family) n=1 Tax=Micromonospora polyrhachis TaxID=1282883 RepID=A0A7W7SVE0_9ACTN|nr:SigE family RNA polymerase sigma factor [Micromonospora polyrhachis]MBB4961062.1 RNA polymerase sigma-70 factor (sigma-E family) [Micromonospora polyrhachis]